MNKLPKQPVYLFASCLYSRYGFCDGDLAYECIGNQLEDGGYVHLKRDEILKRLIDKFLMPIMPEGFEYVEIGTSHNPFRAKEFWEDDVDRYVEYQDLKVCIPFEEAYECVKDLIRVTPHPFDDLR